MLALSTLVAPACVVVLLVAMAAASGRLLAGPHRADRIVALDLLTLLLAALLGVLCIQDDEPAYLAVALVVALVSFVATVAWSFYLERRADRDL